VRRHRMILGGLVLLTAFALTACGVGQRQSPATSEEQTGTTHAAAAEDEKPSTYTTKAGDTLQDVAARPEIYGDPDLWPLLLDANTDSLQGKSGATRLDADIVLDVPRGSAQEVLDAARAKAQELKAGAKRSEDSELAEKTEASRSMPSEPKASDTPVHSTAGAAVAGSGEGSADSGPSPEAKAREAAAKRAIEAQAAAAAAPEAAAAPVAPPAPRHGSRMLPLFFLLLLVLAALGAVLYFFSKRDRQDLD